MSDFYYEIFYSITGFSRDSFPAAFIKQVDEIKVGGIPFSVEFQWDLSLKLFQREFVSAHQVTFLVNLDGVRSFGVGDILPEVGAGINWRIFILNGMGH